jgi:osmoprotectant transport system permease protein
VSLALPLAQVQLRDRSQGTCESRNGFCPDWIADNWENYVDPTVRHALLVALAVLFGFAIAFGLALLAHRRRGLVGPITAITGVLYTIPSLAFFLVLLPLTGRGITTAVIALTAFTLLIIFRNIILGLDNVPEEAVDAAAGMGMTDRQVLWKVELPLAVPEIVAGLRVAATTSVGLAALAFFAGAGGLGGEIYSDLTFKSNIVVAGGLCLLLAALFDAFFVVAERLLTRWRRAVAT